MRAQKHTASRTVSTKIKANKAQKGSVAHSASLKRSLARAKAAVAKKRAQAKSTARRKDKPAASVEQLQREVQVLKGACVDSFALNVGSFAHVRLEPASSCLVPTYNTLADCYLC